MKLVHHHVLHICGSAFAQGDVRQNFRVQQRMGASRLTEASPVLKPTLSGPNSRRAP